FFLIAAKNQTLYSSRLIFNPSDQDLIRVTEPFEVKGRTTNLELYISAPLKNSWAEFQVDLVNDDTGETQEFEQGIEYYTGYDSDGSWSEGSESSTRVLSAIAPGHYHLNIEASGPALPILNSNSRPQSFTSPLAEVRTAQWPNGNLKSKEFYVDGKLDGLVQTFSEAGKLASETTYQQGEKSGPFKTFRSDGTQEQVGQYTKDQLTGLVRTYDADGNLAREARYVGGQITRDPTRLENGSVSVFVEVKRDVTTWKNFFWALLILSIYPVIVLWRRYRFEMARWSNSDHSPYFQSQDDDE
ncbi:MAG: hypothetical protein EOP09_18695, partial [Proteobacteria bacterium]